MSDTSIYADHVAYAKKTRMPIRLAAIWCAHFREIEEKVAAARICPCCGKPTLEYESGEYESGTPDYFYCDNEETECDFHEGMLEGDEVERGWIQFGADFDAILAFATNYAEKSWIGVDTLPEWLEWVRHEVKIVTDTHPHLLQEAHHERYTIHG